MTRLRELALAGLLLAPAAQAVAGSPATDVNGLTRRFADELFAQGDWYRAATEYQRVQSFDPAAVDSQEIAFRIGLCSHRAGRHAEAGRLFAALAGRASSTELQDRCRLYLAAGRFLDGDWEEVHAACAAALAASPASPHRDRLGYLDGLSQLHREEWAAARSAFHAVPTDSALRPTAMALADLADRGEALPPRRPWVNGALSAVVPGLGQIACGYPWDGLSSLVLAGASLALTADGFRRHSGRQETIWLALSAVWYPASIVGGANAARRANRQNREALIAEAGRLSTLSLE